MPDLSPSAYRIPGFQDQTSHVRFEKPLPSHLRIVKADAMLRLQEYMKYIAMERYETAACLVHCRKR